MQIQSLKTSEFSEELWQKLIELCTEAYEEEFEPIFKEIGPSTHLLGFQNGELIAHASYIQRDLRVPNRSFRTAFIEAVAVSPKYQGHRFGKEITASIPSNVAEFDLAALSPSDKSFYSPLGWELWMGPLFYREINGDLVETPNEEVMIYRLPLTGFLDITQSLSCEWRVGDIW